MTPSAGTFGYLKEGQMTTPMYRGIADALRQQIENGEFESGKLPTEQDLQDQYGASRNTVRDAIRQLTTLGLVETKAGQGTFDIPKTEPFLIAMTGDPKTAVDYNSSVHGKAGIASASLIQVEIQEASKEVATSLRVTPGTEVISRHRRRYIDGYPWALETSFYLGEFADRGAERLRKAGDIEDGTVKYLNDAIGILQVGYRDWVTVRSPNGTEAEFFKLPPDGRVAVYEMFRTAFDGNEQPIRLTVTIFRADRNQFVVNVGNVPELKPNNGTQQSLPTTRGAAQASRPGLR
jgi:GntR family transcriptional regulator